MTYESLDNVIKRLSEKSRIPEEQMRRMEIASGERNRMETVMIFGLLPANQYGVRPFVVAGCKMIENNVLLDTERIDCYDPKEMPHWYNDFYDFGASLGLGRSYLEMKLLIVFGGQGKVLLNNF